MIARLLVRSVVISVVLAVAACHSLPAYKPDPNLTSDNAATIVGAKLPMPYIFDSDWRVYVRGVDGVRVDRLVWQWDEPLIIAPGEHDLMLEAEAGSCFGFTDHLRVPLAPGVHYSIKVEKEATHMGFAWIEDEQTLKAVSAKGHFRISCAGAPVFIPLFIPAK